MRLMAIGKSNAVEESAYLAFQEGNFYKNNWKILPKLQKTMEFNTSFMNKTSHRANENHPR